MLLISRVRTTITLLCHLWTLTQWRLRASSSNQLESAAALPACTCHRGANMTYCSDCRHQTHLSGGSHCHHSPAPRWAEAGGFLAWSGELRNKYSILQSHAFTLPPEPLSWVLPNSLNWHFLAPSLETEVALIHRPKSSYFCLRGARDAHDSRHHPSLFNGRQNRTLPPMVPISDTSQHRWSFAKCVSPKIEFNLFPDSTSS